MSKIGLRHGFLASISVFRESRFNLDAVYAKVITAGTHLASSIRVAEAAKVIENIQRDVNIALINELAMLFKQLGLPSASHART